MASTSISSKCLCSSLSPTEEKKSTKKANMSDNKSISSESGTGKEPNISEELKDGTSIDELKDIISSLVEEVRMLKDTVHSDIKELKDVVKTQQKDISQLEESLALSHQNVKGCLTDRIDKNMTDIQQIIIENKQLCKENDQLIDRITKIEMTQLENNVIISGQPEQPWETYDLMKQHVIDTIVSTMGPSTDNVTRQEASKIEISSCSRVGRYKSGKIEANNSNIPQKGRQAKPIKH